jgi:peptidoglycan/LPS O-acetylase OafA/YrhL
VHSVGASIERRLGRMPGLGQCRVIAVLGLLACQSYEVSDSVGMLSARPFWVLPSFFMAALFALLGFSIAQSRARSQGRLALSKFISARLRRTVPAYFLIILVAAFIIGPLTTSDTPLRYYLSDTDLWLYLLNLIGIPQFALPGVFEINSLPSVVNAIVWTVPVYLVLLLTVTIADQDRRITRLLPGGLVFVILAICLGLQLTDHQPSTLIGFSNYLVAGQAPGALLSGLAGVLTYQFRDHVPRGRRLATGAALLLALIALGGNASWLAKPLFYCLSALPVAYLAIYLCLRPLPYQGLSDRLRPYLTGLFLYSFPIQQLVVAFGPREQDGLTNLMVSLPLSLALATASSRFAENRLLLPHQKVQVAAHAADTRQDVRKLRRSLPSQLRRSVPSLLGFGLFLIIIIGVMGMVYLAMLQDAGGI